MMCANDMSVLMRTFIGEINNGTLDKNKYLKLTFEMFLEHPNYKMYKDIIKEHPKIRKQYEECETFDNMKKILQMPVFKDHAKFIDAYFYTYESMNQYYKHMAGIIGYIFQENVYLPDSF